MTVFRKFEVCASYESSLVKSPPSPSRKPLSDMLMGKKTTKKPSKIKKDNQQKILSEIGHFVVEFENLQKTVKQLLIDSFEFEELKDQNLIEIILYQSTSYDLTEYFRGITLYQLSKLEMKYKSNDDKKRIEIVRDFIKIANLNLQEAATFRNDLLHSSYDNRTIIDWKENNDFKLLTKFQGQRSKIRSKGIELNHIIIEPNTFTSVFEMMMILKFLIDAINMIINKGLFKTFNKDESHLMIYKSIDIKSERAKHFTVSENYYQNNFTNRKDNKEREEYFRAVESGEIKGGS